MIALEPLIHVRLTCSAVALILSSLFVNGLSLQAETPIELGRIETTNNKPIKDLQIAPDGTLYATTAQEEQYYRSIDAGKSWTIVQPPGKIRLLSDGRLARRLYSLTNQENDGIYISLDRGETWSRELNGPFNFFESDSRDRLILRQGARGWFLVDGTSFDYNTFSFSLNTSIDLSYKVLVAGDRGIVLSKGKDIVFYDWEQKRRPTLMKDGTLCKVGDLVNLGNDTLIVSITRRGAGGVCRAGLLCSFDGGNSWNSNWIDHPHSLSLLAATPGSQIYAVDNTGALIHQRSDDSWIQILDSTYAPTTLNSDSSGNLYIFTRDKRLMVMDAPITIGPWLTFDADSTTAVALRNQAHISEVRFVNTGDSLLTVDSLSLSSIADSPISIESPAQDFPLRLQPQESYTIRVRTEFSDSRAADVEDVLNAHSGAKSWSHKFKAELRIPGLSAELQGKFSQRFINWRQKKNFTIRAGGTHTLIIDSLSLSSDPRYRFSLTSDSPELPRKLPVGSWVNLFLDFTPLVQDTMSLHVIAHTDGGDFHSSISVKTGSIAILNTTRENNSDIQLPFDSETVQYLTVKNSGHVDFEIGNIALLDSNSLLTLAKDFDTQALSLATGDLLSLPFIIQPTTETNISATLQVHTQFGLQQRNFQLSHRVVQVPSQADWKLTLPSHGSARYSANGRHVIFTSDKQVKHLIDAANGSLLATTSHYDDLKPQPYQIVNYVPLGSPGFNSDASLCARGTMYVDDDSLRTAIQLFNPTTGLVRDTIDLQHSKWRVMIAEFLPGDSLLAISMHRTASGESSSSTVYSKGRFGVYSITDKQWIWMSNGLPSIKITISPSGQFVHFNKMFFSYDFSATPYYSTNIAYSSIVFDVANRQIESNLFPNFSVSFNPADQGRIYRQKDAESNYLQSAYYWHGPDNIILRRFSPELSQGLFLPEGDYFAHIPKIDHQAQNRLDILHIPSGAIKVGECFIDQAAFTSFSISPDGSKIVFSGPNGTIWQQDFDCEFDIILPTDVNESPGSAPTGFRLAPNPVNSLLLVSHPEVSSGAVRILDMTGREALNLAFNNKQKTQLDVSSLTSGIYLLEVLNGAERQQQLFVKR